MILDNRIKEFNYATLIVFDYHAEYPLQGKAQVIWDYYAIEEVMRQLRVTDVDLNMTSAMVFKDLTQRYNGAYEHNAGLLYQIRGSVSEIRLTFDDLAQQLMGGPRGADDDTFDYWPNAFDMLYVMAQDLIELDPDSARYTLGTVVRVIDSAIALQGPLSEWEAEGLDTNLQHLMELTNERKEA